MTPDYGSAEQSCVLLLMLSPLCSSGTIQVAVWLSGNVLGRINKVNQRRARLVLRWVIVGR